MSRSMKKAAPPQTSNVFEAEPEIRRLWHFQLSNGEPHLAGEFDKDPPEPLPAAWITKDWHSLWRHKLNIAWLPTDQICLRVAQLPASEPSELTSMVELQLEKLSPLPPSQIIWSVEVIPGVNDGLQTVVVLMVPRTIVEDFLGHVETQGFLPDRLEFPMLHQMMANPPPQEGLWVHPSRVAGQDLCLAGWWSGGILRNLNLTRLSKSPNWADVYKEQLTQIAWAGENEGWLTLPIRCQLVAGTDLGSIWEPLLAEWSGQPVEIVAPLEPKELAALNVRHVAQQKTKANLLPPEYATRYHQLLIDRLWMRGLFALGVVYLAGVLVYFAALQVLNFQTHRVEAQVAGLSQDYTNAMQLKARVLMLQDQANLKYAALDCWKAAAELLPEGLTLTDLSLQQGKTLTLRGTAPPDQVQQILNYNQALSRVRVGGPNGPLLFRDVEPYKSSTSPNGSLITWSFPCHLYRDDLE